MPYIGRDTDKLSNIEVLDNITFDGSSSYTLQKGGSNFTPSSANNILISIDGVVQAGNFTVSSSTIDFGTAVAGTSTCDFILHYGIGLITSVSDGTVTEAKIGSGAVTSAKMFSGFANGITEADQWRLTANITADVDPISSNLERVDDGSFGYIGTGMSVSSGTWTFPSTGLYQVGATIYTQPNADALAVTIQATQNNSTYDAISNVYGGGAAGYGRTHTGFSYVNVTDTSNVKVRFGAESIASGSTIEGNTNSNLTSFNFIRLGDSV